MALRQSNSKYLTVTEKTIRDDSGWRIDVFDHNNPTTLVARIERWESFGFNIAENGIGVGEVQWNSEDAIFSEELTLGFDPQTLWSRPYYWCFYQDNNLRYRMFYNERRSDLETVAGERLVKIAGLSVGALLGHAIVLPEDTLTYENATWAEVFIPLVNAAKERGVLPQFIRPTFKGATDSKGEDWRDRGTITISPGETLLKLMEKWGDKFGFRWRVDHDGRIFAGYEIGQDRSQAIRFFPGVDISKSQEIETAKDVRNDIRVKAPDGTVYQATDADSQNDWMVRESFITVDEGLGSDGAQIAAQAQLKLSKDALRSKTFTVQMDPRGADGQPVGRSLFFDYTISDIVGYGTRTDTQNNDFAIVELAVEVDHTMRQTVEITVASRYELELERLQRLLEEMVGEGNYSSSVGDNSTDEKTTTVAVRTFEQMIADTVLDDLNDVAAAAPADQQVLTFNSATGKWEPLDYQTWDDDAPSDSQFYGRFNSAWLASSPVLVLGPADPVPPGTPPAVIVRLEA